MGSQRCRAFLCCSTAAVPGRPAVSPATGGGQGALVTHKCHGKEMFAPCDPQPSRQDWWGSGCLLLVRCTQFVAAATCHLLLGHHGRTHQCLLVQARCKIISGPKSDVPIVCPRFWVNMLMKFRPAQQQHRMSLVLKDLSQDPPRRCSLKGDVLCCYMHVGPSSSDLHQKQPWCPACILQLQPALKTVPELRDYSLSARTRMSTILWQMPTRTVKTLIFPHQRPNPIQFTC